MMESLERFHEAQGAAGSGFAAALAEIRSGCKRSHWIWYVFPQIEGLGHSATARFFALCGLDEACAYLRDPVLASRYQEITGAVAEQLRGQAGLEGLMGSQIDALKLVSSLTLFRAAAARRQTEDAKALSALCDEVLRAASLQGFPPCAHTLSRVTAGR